MSQLTAVDEEKTVAAAMDVEDDAEESVEDGAPKDVLLTAAELRFKLRLETANNAPEAKESAEELLKIFKEHNMIEMYKATWEENNSDLDSALLLEMETQRTTRLTEFDEKQKEAETNEGDVEVHDIQLEKSHYLAMCSSLDEAVKAGLAIKNLTSGKNIDKYLSILRLCFAWNNDHAYKKHLEETARLIDKGGDWDRRNRFTVYNGVHNFRSRNFAQSAKNFLDAIATFTATEVFDYKRLVHFTIIAAVVSLERTELKKKLIDSPEVIQVIDEMPVFKEFLNSFYDCRYTDFFRSLLEVMDYIRKDVHLSIHSDYYLREIRLRAYQQFLRSYRSVTLASMAGDFGVSQQFLDEELSSYIASGGLTCKIDKVDGVVQMSRVDKQSSQYQELMRKGDVLLNRVQRLSRIITY